MDKKPKEALRRLKKPRPASSSDSSSSSDSDSSSSDSYSSSSSKKKAAAHRKKKLRARRSSSSSDDDRARKRDKHACHKNLEAKRNQLRRKLKEAKAKKRTTSPGQRRRSVSPSHKLKKVAAGPSGEKKHHRMSSKERMMREREREREKLRARDRERGRSRSPKSSKMARPQGEPKRKSPMGRHQLSPREKIIIQARRDRSPVDRKREMKIRLDSRERERRDRERDRDVARNKEREEALARCQERQRERERLARDKLRREKEKEYERDRLLPRPAEREMAIAAARGFESRERSLEQDPRARHLHAGRSAREVGLEREREFEHHRVALERDERREHDREYLVAREAARRRELEGSPGPGLLYAERLRAERELYPDERGAYARAYEGLLDDPRARERSWERGERDLRREHEHAKLYAAAERAGTRDWKLGEEEWHAEHAQWEEKNWQRGKKHAHVVDGDWEAAEKYALAGKNWEDSVRGKHDALRVEGTAAAQHAGAGGRRWPQEWRGNHQTAAEGTTAAQHRHTGPQQNAFRHNQLGGHSLEYTHERGNYRHHHPQQHAHQHQVGYHHPRAHFPSKRQMTYTNPNLLKKPLVPATATTASAVAEAELDETATATTTVDQTVEASVNSLPESKQEEDGSEEKLEQSEQPDEGEIVSPTEKTPVESLINAESETTAEVANEAEDVIPDDLSEISDGADDILEKEEEKNNESRAELGRQAENENGDPATKSENPVDGDDTKDGGETNGLITDPKEDEDLLDFEEISDGELEEESRNKGVGDALGVDWASLVAETKVHENKLENSCTAKEKWQPHRIILDVGISFKYAGEEFARAVIADAKRKLDEEMGNQINSTERKIKVEVKEDEEETVNGESSPTPVKEETDANFVHPLACVQVAQRLAAEDRKNLVFNACGPNSRALSARQDLRLRRKLCGLPIKEIDFPRPVSENMKALALKAFQRAIQA